MDAEDSKIVEEGMAYAIWSTASPHEWKWTNEQALKMARACCVLNHQNSKLIEFVEYLSKGLEHIAKNGAMYGAAAAVVQRAVPAEQ